MTFRSGISLCESYMTVYNADHGPKIVQNYAKQIGYCELIEICLSRGR